MLHPVNADIFCWMLGLTTCTRIPPFPLPILPGYISRKISYVSPCGLDHIADFLHMSLGYRHIGPGIHTYPSKMLFWIKILEDWYEHRQSPLLSWASGSYPTDLDVGASGHYSSGGIRHGRNLPILHLLNHSMPGVSIPWGGECAADSAIPGKFLILLSSLCPFTLAAV